MSGGLGRVYVEVGPNGEGRAPVRFAETVSGGVGDAWRAAVWMALLSASARLELDPMAQRVTVEAQDPVDGPSAGALMTAMIMAGILGHPVSPDATLTGTVNPDLTVGPVGGIPEKVVAALDGGKTRIGIPVGQSQAMSVKTKRPVDVVMLARRRGARVFVMRDVGDAYEVLTGERLPRAVALPQKEMTLPSDVAAVFAEHAGMAVKDILGQQKKFKELIDSAPYVAARRWRARLLAGTKEVAVMVSRGDSVAAMYRAAELQGSHYRLTTGLLTRIGADLKRWKYVRALLRTLRYTVGRLLEEAVPRWKRLHARQALDVPFMVDTFEAFIHALREFAQVERVLSQNRHLKRFLTDERYVPTGQKELADLEAAVMEFSGRLIGAQSNLLLGRVYLAIGEGREKAAKAGPATERRLSRVALERLTKQYQRVADANLQYANSLLVAREAERTKKSPAEIRKRLMALDEDYRQAVMNRHLPALLSGKGLSKRELGYANLTGAVSSYFASAQVISKRYSLNAEFDKAGRTLVGVRHKAAFESMLGLADRQARQAAARCRERLGEIPVSSLIEYRLARNMEADGVALIRAGGDKRSLGVRLRLEALGHLWRASTMARLALEAKRYGERAAEAP